MIVTAGELNEKDEMKHFSFKYNICTAFIIW